MIAAVIPLVKRRTKFTRVCHDLDSAALGRSAWAMRILILAALMAVSAWGADETFKAGSFTFQKPANFKLKNAAPGGMRAAELEFGEAGKAAEAIFYFFGQGQGGDRKANVDRWLNAFEEPREKINSKVETKKVGGSEVTFVEAEGTYKSGMPGTPPTPKPGTKLLGAILESPSGNVYVRMTGPIATVKAADGDFRKMIESGLK